MMPTVFSFRDGKAHPGAVSIARPGRWGNRISYVQHGVDGERAFADAVARYRAWVMAPGQVEFRHKVRAELKGKDLICWCKPLPCHGDVLLEVANSDA